MEIAAIDYRKYNLDMILIDPCVHSSNHHYATNLTRYKMMLKGMFITPTITNNINIKYSLDNNIIEFVINLTGRDFSTYKTAKYFVLTETNFNNMSDNDIWYVTKVNNIKREDVNTYRFIVTVDNVRTFINNNKVFKLYDNYNGNSHLSGDDITLNYPVDFYRFYNELSNYVAVGVWIGDFYSSDGRTPRNSKFTGLGRGFLNGEYQGVNRLVNYANQVYSASYLTVFTKQQAYGLEQDLLSDSDFQSDLQQTTLSDSIISLNDCIHVLNSIGTSSENIAKNLVSVYLVPKIFISSIAVSAGFFARPGAVGGQDNYYYYEGALRANYNGMSTVQWRRFGYVCMLSDVWNETHNIETTLNNLVNTYYRDYGSSSNNNFRANKYIKATIDTYQNKYDINYNLIYEMGNLIHIVPLFNGSLLNYYIEFGRKNLSNEYVVSNSGIRITGKSFAKLPTTTLGVDAYFASEYKIDTVKTTGLVAANVIGGVSSAAVGILSTINGNAVGAIMGAAGTVKSVTSTVNNLNEFKRKNFEEQSQTPDLSAVSEIFITLLDGLFKITYYIGEIDERALIIKQNNFYGIYADCIYDNDVTLDFTKTTQIPSISQNKVVYHKGGGVFSSDELLEIFNNGVFVFTGEEQFDEQELDHELDIISAITYQGISAN